MYAYYLLHKHHRFPSEYLNLPFHERAAVAVFIEKYQRKERLEAMRRKAQSGKGGSKPKRPRRGRR